MYISFMENKILSTLIKLLSSLFLLIKRYINIFNMHETLMKPIKTGLESNPSDSLTPLIPRI